MPILNYTTTVAATKTVGEIQSILAKAGASRTLLDYENAMPVALVFELHGFTYRLPCRHEAVYIKLHRDSKVPPRLSTREQALRVAWRILKDWTEAQMAIIETGMVQADEVFMPYQLLSSGQSFYEHYNARQLEAM